MKNTLGYVHSFQSLGAVDGPGVRFTVFLSGCNLRCSCCHNPDTWTRAGSDEFTAEEIVKRATRYKEYFGKEGGITLSGGEPLLQPSFSKAIFSLAKKEGINTCLDTSGSLFSDEIKELLSYTDRVLLDIKYTNEEDYIKHVGCSFDAPVSFLDYLDKEGIKTTLRQVIIPGLNDTDENILLLKGIKDAHPCVDKIELLPFRKVCITKYEQLGIPFPLHKTPEPSEEKMKGLAALLD